MLQLVDLHGGVSCFAIDLHRRCMASRIDEELGRRTERRKFMTWLTANWFWVLIFIAFIGMHMFCHGGHGTHTGHA